MMNRGNSADDDLSWRSWLMRKEKTRLVRRKELSRNVPAGEFD
jgi:hypothetical protein